MSVCGDGDNDNNNNTYSFSSSSSRKKTFSSSVLLLLLLPGFEQRRLGLRRSSDSLCFCCFSCSEAATMLSINRLLLFWRGCCISSGEMIVELLNMVVIVVVVVVDVCRVVLQFCLLLYLPKF